MKVWILALHAEELFVYALHTDPNLVTLKEKIKKV